MLDIFICEDNEGFRIQLENHVNDYIEDYGLEARVLCSSPNPQDILDELKRKEINQGLFFIDIDLGNNEMGGIYLAQEIRQQYWNAMIVIVTTMDYMMPAIYQRKIGALDFVVKDDEDSLKGIERRVEEILQHAMKTLANESFQESTELFEVKRRSGSTYYKVSDIISFSTGPGRNQLTLYATNAFCEFHGTIKETVKKSDAFVSCSQSEIINLNHLVRIEGNKAIMSDGAEIPISRRNLKKVRSEWEKNEDLLLKDRS